MSEVIVRGGTILTIDGASRVLSRSPAGTRSPLSIIALPATARMPQSRRTSKLASVWWTVPMSWMAVVPPRKSSTQASRVAAATSSRASAAS